MPASDLMLSIVVVDEHLVAGAQRADVREALVAMDHARPVEAELRVEEHRSLGVAGDHHGEGGGATRSGCPSAWAARDVVAGRTGLTDRGGELADLLPADEVASARG